MTPELGTGQPMGKSMNPVTSMTSPNPTGSSQGQDSTISSNTSTFSSPGAPKDPAAVGPVQGYRFGCPGTMSHTAPMQGATPQGGGYSLKMNSPSQGSPGMLSPRHRASPGIAGSPRLPPPQFSPAHTLHSPVPMCTSSSGGSGNVGGTHGYTSSSLSALQALSDCHSINLGQTLGSPDRKLASPANPGGVNPHLMHKLGSAESFGDPSQPEHGGTTQGDVGEEQRDDKGNPDSAENRVHDSKGHTKLLQLLTTKTEPIESTSPPPGTGGELGCKETPGGPGAQSGASGTHATSLKEKHKILHRLLQNSTSPVDLAKLTAEATGKEMCQDGSGGGANVAELKQEPVSPKKKDNALLRYLLDKDDNVLKDKGVKIEPGEVKTEGAKVGEVKVEKPDRGYERVRQVREDMGN